MGARNEHGTAACYQGGCRCDDCKEAKRQYRLACEQRRAVETPTATTNVSVQVCCRSCGGGVYLLAEGRPAADGSRKVASYKCASCKHEHLLTLTWQSLRGGELEGAA